MALRPCQYVYTSHWAWLLALFHPCAIFLDKSSVAQSLDGNRLTGSLRTPATGKPVPQTANAVCPIPAVRGRIYEFTPQATPMMALDYDLLESLKHTAQFDTANFGILLRAAFREH